MFAGNGKSSSLPSDVGRHNLLRTLERGTYCYYSHSSVVMRADVCRFSENEDFLKSLTALTKKAKCKLTVCPQEENLDDQWMQVRDPVHLRPRDSLELGDHPSWDGLGGRSLRRSSQQGAQAESSSDIDCEPLCPPPSPCPSPDSHLVPFAHLPSDISLLTHIPVMLIKGQQEGCPSVYAVPPVGLRPSSCLISPALVIPPL